MLGSPTAVQIHLSEDVIQIDLLNDLGHVARLGGLSSMWPCAAQQMLREEWVSACIPAVGLAKARGLHVSIRRCF